jgi:hypothetical protein
MFEFRNGSLHAESVPLEAVARVIASGGDPGKAIFSGAGKSAAGVMVNVAKTHLIRERGRPEALFALEHLLR